jgi:DNA-3-methyladenine glycosylase II
MKRQFSERRTQAPLIESPRLKVQGDRLRLQSSAACGRSPSAGSKTRERHLTVPSYWRRATQELAARDAVLAELIKRHRALSVGMRGDAFQTLARAIVGQQISVKAAQSVWERLVATVGNIEPHQLAQSEPTTLRTAGLSGRKVEYIQDLARRFCDRSIDASALPTLSDEAVVEHLIAVRGVGRWTAEMFLIFNLGRPDVLPLGDLGLQRAISLSYNRGRAVSERRMRLITRAWAPWRSVATWYMWRSLEPLPTTY